MNIVSLLYGDAFSRVSVLSCTFREIMFQVMGDHGSRNGSQASPIQFIMKLRIAEAMHDPS